MCQQQSSPRETIEAALRAREAELARVQRIGRVGGFEIDLRGGQFRNYRSPEYLDLHGLPPDAAEEAHEAWVGRLHPEDRERAETYFKNTVLGDGCSYESEYRIIVPGEGVRWISATAEIERDADGTALRMVGVHIDVTRIRDAEHAQRASEARLRDVLEAIDEAYYALDADERFVNASRRALEMWGLSPAEVLGRRLTDVFPRAAEGVTYQSMRQCMRTGLRARSEGRAVSLHGRWVEQDSYPTAGGGVAVAFRDIHDRKQTELALRQSEAQFRTLAEAMPNHVWTATPDGSLDWFNERVYEYCGAVPGALDGDGWTRIVHPDDLPAAAALWAAALTGGQNYEAEFRLRRSDGIYHWHIARAVGLRAEDGTISRWIGTNTDIDHQKSSAEALARLNTSLEQQVLERTGELMASEAALRQSQKMEAVGQLTGGIAHDFNNMLQAISGGLTLMQRRIADGRTAEVADLGAAIRKSLDRAAGLTHRLLAFSRRQTLQPSPVEPYHLVRGMEELIRNTIGPAVTLSLRLQDGLWQARSDPNQLESALLNLAINARDAMPRGGTLTIASADRRITADMLTPTDEAGPGDYVEIRVMDTGVGMSADVLARAFEPFFTTKPIGTGTGLGLSQLYGFVRQSGGFVRLESVPAKGTTVRMFLPRDDGTALAPPPPAVAPASDATASLAGRIVLLVEDEDDVRAQIADSLRELGCTVLQATDGPAGLRIVQSGAAFDLLVTDIGLPGLNGRQLAEAARASRPNLPVLMITGYAGAAPTDLTLPQGMQILAKPFQLTALTERVTALLS